MTSVFFSATPVGKKFPVHHEGSTEEAVSIQLVSVPVPSRIPYYVANASRVDIGTDALATFITSTVLQRFSQIPEVAVIYRTIDENVLIFWIFTTNTTYDDALMDRLLLEETGVLDAYSTAIISFQYVHLALCPSPEELVGANAIAILKR